MHVLEARLEIDLATPYMAKVVVKTTKCHMLPLVYLRPRKC